MPRQATGQVIVDDRRKSPTFGLRFTALGRRQYVSLGSTEDGWTHKKAQDELENEVAKVKLGIWEPPKPVEPEPAPDIDQDPLFHEFATDWFEATKGEWRENTRLDYEWQLSHHLLKFFARHRLSQITIAEVDRYKAQKVREVKKVERIRIVDGKRVKVLEEVKLSPASINKTITRLGQILEQAVEYGLIERNPARGKRRKVKVGKPAPVWLDSAERIEALLDAAGELDRKAPKDRRHVERRAMLTTLALAGLRIGELIELRWRDVDFTEGKITVRASKTDAGMRRVDLKPRLRAELEALRARAAGRGAVQANVLDLEAHRARRRQRVDAGTLSAGRVFATREGGALSPSNVRNRVLTPAAKLASGNLEAAGATPLPDGLTPHKLRHTWCSIQAALGVDPRTTMNEGGWTDAAFMLRVYDHEMRRDEESKARLVTFVNGGKRQRKGSSGVLEGAEASRAAEV